MDLCPDSSKSAGLYAQPLFAVPCVRQSWTTPAGVYADLQDALRAGRERIFHPARLDVGRHSVGALTGSGRGSPDRGFPV